METPRFLRALLAALIFVAFPVTSQAQSFNADSFFNVFTEISLPDLQCDPCEALKADINDLQSEIDDLKDEIQLVKNAVESVESDIEDAKADLTEARAELEEFNNPTNYVEDDQGRRYDSSDNAAMKRRSENLWEAYQDGDISAKEYSDEVGKSFHDPDVQAELEKIKEQLRKEMEQRIEDLEDEISDLKDEKEDLEDEAEDLADEMDDLLDELEDLTEDLADCLQKCKEGPVNVPEDYGIGQGDWGFFDWFGEFFSGLFGGGEDLPPPGDADTLVQRLGTPDLGLPPGDTVPVEMVQLNLKSVEPIDLGDFGLGNITLPLPDPVCHVCDPILKEIKKKQKECTELSAEHAAAQALLVSVNVAITTSEVLLEDAEKALDAFNNPSDYVKDNRGRRYDSSDNAAMKRRNANLWADYKAGKLSADELSAEWGKNFYDPDVQADIQRIKDQMRKELEARINNLKKNITDLQTKKADLAKKIANLEQGVKECENQVSLLKKKYDDCRKKCKLPEPKVEDILIDDFYGIDDIPLISEDDEDEGLLCNWFRIGCKEIIPPDVTLGDLGVDDLPDLDLSLDGPGGLDFPLDISGMDGNDALTVDDLGPAQDCLFDSGSCDGLLVDDPPFDVLGGMLQDDLLGLGPDDFQIRGGPGDDLLLGHPGDDLIGVDGIPDFGSNPIPPDFFGPGSDPFDGGPLLFGPGGELITDPGLPPDPAGLNELGGCLAGSDAPACNQGVPANIRVRLNLQPGDTARCEVTVIRIGNRRIVRIKCTIIHARSSSSSSITDVISSSSVSSVEDQVPDCGDVGYASEAACQAACTREGSRCSEFTAPSGAYCWACVEAELVQCPAHHPYEGSSTCEEACSNGDCDLEWYGEKRCFACVQCPSGEFYDLRACESYCDPREGDCRSRSRSAGQTEFSCYECLTCPEGEYAKWSRCVDVCGEGNMCDTGSKEGCYVCRIEDEEPPEECDSPTMDLAVCEDSCEDTGDGICTKAYTRDDGVKCYSCVTDDEPEECPGDTYPADVCLTQCDGTCRTTSTLSDGIECQLCEMDDEPQCPSGTVADLGDCESQCPSDGTCILNDDGCYECLVVHCPDGTYKDECPASCTEGCSVAAEQNGVQCFQCNQNCEDVCAEHGYGPEDTDHSDAILAELNGYECVSGAGISIQTATIGDCNCVGDYSINVDTTPPVCEDTPCGNVQCGGSETCSTGPNETTTVHCNWGGWEKVQKHQFRPVFGG